MVKETVSMTLTAALGELSTEKQVATGTLTGKELLLIVHLTWLVARELRPTI